MAKNQKIFVNIASYRDPELLPTIKDCIEQAKYPDRLRFGICWQHTKDDEWDQLDEYLDDKRFSIDDVDIKDSRGACWARSRTQKLYNGEEFLLQLDSHHRFIKNWDEELIDTFYQCIKAGYKKPLLTSYIPQYFPDKHPQESEMEPWYLCFDRFAPEGPLHTKPHTLVDHQQYDLPVPARFLSAHFIFTYGKFNIEVPYDPSLYFHGEEITMAVRAYTHGYDLLAPHRVFAWHHYGRDFDVKHWSDHDISMLDTVSYKRVRQLLGIDIKCRPCVLRQLKPYTFGKERTIQDYERYAGVHFTSRRIQDYTLQHHHPPNPVHDDIVEYDASLKKYQNFCIDVHKKHMPLHDYEFVVVSFEKHNGEVIHREDLQSQQFYTLMDKDLNNEFINIWKNYIGDYPDKVVVWPFSKSKGWVDRWEYEYKEKIGG